MEDTQFPIGTLVYYGPDNQTVTKITASILFSAEAAPLQKEWSGDNIITDPQMAAELARFFQTHAVKRVVMADHVEGCPHLEGIDYPAGEDCPHCPFWQKTPPGG